MSKLQSAVVLVLHNPTRKILTVTNQAHGGIGLPGGKVEPEETVEAAAVRELLEEVTLTVDVRDLHPIYTASWRFVRRDGLAPPREVTLYLATRVRGTPFPAENGTAIEWVTFDQLIARSPFGSYYMSALPKGVDHLSTTLLPDFR